jgi:hypothetical protein
MMDEGDKGESPGYIVLSSAGGVDVAIGVDSSSRHPEGQLLTFLKKKKNVPAGTQPDLDWSGKTLPMPSGSFWTIYHPFALDRIANVEPL